MFDKNLESIAHTFHRIITVNSLSLSLQQFISKFKIQMLAMPNCSNSFINEWCRKLVIERSAFYSEVPVLVIPEMGINTATNKRSSKLYPKHSSHI
jgi:hypothetical protein